MKLEVGKYYELNNGSMHKCTKMIGDDPHAVDESGYGPFVIDGMCYHQDGRWADYASHDPLSVRRCVEPARDPELTSPHGDVGQPGTLKELGVKKGDVVEWIGFEDVGHHTLDFIRNNVDYVFDTKSGPFTHNIDCKDTFRIISRAPDTPKTWGEMTDAEKGALLLADHEGKVIEVWHDDLARFDVPLNSGLPFRDWHAYRVRPEPKRETVALCWRRDVPCVKNKIGTIDLINGEPDCASIKMERIND